MGVVSGTNEAIVAIRFRLPPGMNVEQAGKMLSQGGINIPLGLLNNVRKVDVAIIAVDEPYTILPPEDGSAILHRN